MPAEDVSQEDVCGVQCMTADTWLEVIEQEKLRGDGHVGPTGVGNYQRSGNPDKQGCGCPQCVAADYVAYFAG
jgi:hypothetical protein